MALPLMTSGSGIYAGMAVYAGGLAVSYLCGFVLTWLFGSKNVDLS
ncbi:PTS system, N-acetylmuramic acid-specific IIB component / PTS system, N-acetylmuramic acid-specific IIC component [Klebsiella pneumoniae IS43]|nr:PTS system, N-acetylmuramic acid-specific IIB component / PTS system, N-acetylmuramic acid-specific IIC component [Klebsiella pneumoniae IS43]